ncbi:type IX secretion system membrane protein PorP/SprF [Cellulophaga sp. HaHaR_3_176]|uniref:PorP/SprF family type IX secretion system membrane protein n=1 Tax=Cellulophaga sp. HaHaR_3_176 TaxID=1942464 RepID=UPI001C1F8B98|nr:type IX secretion system membrane protein PorP/SprF [Cellulophaga sp. HaHaR_3_176]QWX84645.1 type IX secretion system membrane protein PorP/SprF [Cellulophaga sp. HaHaR_3_176]
MKFRKNIKILAIIMLVILPFFGEALAQQDAQYTQYMYNTLAVNPAYAGSRGALSIAALHRSQWVGIDGAPTTQTFNIHSPVSSKVGVGISIVNDEIGNGTNQDTYFDATFSYTVLTSEKDKLSLGLKAGGHFLNIDFNKLRNYNPLANTVNSGIDKKFSPNFGAGVYFHNERFYVGLSVPNILKTTHFDDSSSTATATDRMNFYLISGYVFDLSYNLKLKPAFLVKAVDGAPIQADLSATMLYNEKFSLGAAYRWDAAISALVGFQITDRLMLGLAYDKDTTALGDISFNDGSFEVFIRYEFKSRHRNALTPRFF